MVRASWFVSVIFSGVSFDRPTGHKTEWRGREECVADGVCDDGGRGSSCDLARFGRLWRDTIPASHRCASLAFYEPLDCLDVLVES